MRVKNQYSGAIKSSTVTMPAIIYEVSGIGTQGLNLTPTVIDLSTEDHSDSNFSVVGGTVTYSGVTAIFEIEYCASSDCTSNTRSVARYSIYRNDGGGFAEITRSTAFSYHRNVADGESSASKSIFLELNAGEEIEVRASTNSAGDTVQVFRLFTNLKFKQIV